jgi:four helix bundle protein
MSVFSVENLQVFQKALAAAAAISAITRRPTFLGDQRLREQLRSASGGIPANIAEGHGQKTDKHFARYLYIARGSAREVVAHLAVAASRGLVTDPERVENEKRYDEIARMLSGLIRHLETENRTRRG